MLHWAIVLFIIYLFYIVIKPKKRKRATTTNTKQSPQISTNSNLLGDVYEWPELGNFDFEIVGESNYQNNIALIGKQNPDLITAILVPEPNNQYDTKAIRVDINGLIVGYLSKDDARSFHRRLGNKKISGKATKCKAIITGGHLLKSGNKASYGVQLDIKPFNN